MNVKLVNPVLSSMVNILAMMAKMEVTPGKPSLKKDDKGLGEVSGIISMSGPQVRGSVAISISKPVILELCRRMLHKQPIDIDDMAADLTAELTNMVAGGAKSALEEQGYKLEMSLPQVRVGKFHTVEHTTHGQTILLPFYCKVGKIYVEICFE